MRRHAPYICIRICFCADFFVQQGSFCAVPMSGWKNANAALVVVKMQTMVVFFARKSVWNGKIQKTSLLFELGYSSFFPFSDFSAKACKNAEECGIL
ncbi:MAG: hypothetical protein IKA53_05220 [Clostridia bacterium]|nr:hypothetical protein [Clostridia bacterium]